MAVSKKTRQASRRRGGSNLAAALCVAVGLVVAAFVLARSNTPVEASSGSQTVTPVVGQFDTISVPVPASVVPAGAKLKEARFKMVQFPKHQVPVGAVVDLTGITEAVALAPLPANLPIFRENISLTASATNPIISSIPEGMRAITVKVDATAAVEGWAGTGALIDVLLVTKDHSTVVAEKVKILSAERSIEPVSTASTPDVPSTVTLLVTQDQALAISAAVTAGKIAFALRSNDDSLGWTKSRFRKDELDGRPKETKVPTVSGYVSLGKNDKYTLVDGKWVRNLSATDGFVENTEGQNE